MFLSRSIQSLVQFCFYLFNIQYIVFIISTALNFTWFPGKNSLKAFGEHIIILILFTLRM